jgi:uncharacterized OB-fold protein
MIGQVSRDAATADFFDGARDGVFMLRYNAESGKYLSPLAVIDPDTGKGGLEWRGSKGEARIVSHSVAHGKVGKDGQRELLVIAIVEFDEGPWWWTQILDVQDPRHVRSGQRVRAAFVKNDGEEVVPVFRPV